MKSMNLDVMMMKMGTRRKYAFPGSKDHFGTAVGKSDSRPPADDAVARLWEMEEAALPHHLGCALVGCSLMFDFVWTIK